MSDSGISIHLQGAAELKKIMDAFGADISKRAGVVGVRKGAMIMRRELKAASPKFTGRLAKQWRYKKIRTRRNSGYVGYYVNLRGYQFYSTLEYGNKRVERPTHPFAERTMERASKQAMAAIMAGTKTAIAVEAGKAWAKSQRLR